MVYARFCGSLRAWIDLWFFAGGVAIRHRKPFGRSLRYGAGIVTAPSNKIDERREPVIRSNAERIGLLAVKVDVESVLCGDFVDLYRRDEVDQPQGRVGK